MEIELAAVGRSLATTTAAADLVLLAEAVEPLAKLLSRAPAKTVFLRVRPSPSAPPPVATATPAAAAQRWGVVHSGGKKVLDCVLYSLGLSKHDIRHSLSSLKQKGNMSSASFLWAYDALLREDGAKRGEYGVFITMGPGAGVECALWRF